MKKEINSIRVKDISQGGLTQGQQTQIARNEQRISQVYHNYVGIIKEIFIHVAKTFGLAARCTIFMAS